LAMGRGGWSAAANSIILENAPVNIGAKATFDASTRVLTVNVDLFYTATETVANNINVAFIQDGLVSKQSGGTPDPNNYTQNNVLRHYITGQWGDAVPVASQSSGSKYSKTYTYTVPADYNGATVPPGGGAVVMANCRIVVFVDRGQTEILNGIKAAIQ